MAEKRRRISAAEVLGCLDNLPSDYEESGDELLDALSADDNFPDPDSDRDSNYEVSDGISGSDDSDVLYTLRDRDRTTSENSDEPEGNANDSDNDTNNWKQVEDHYAPPADIPFIATSGLTAQANINSAMEPVAIYEQFVTDEIIRLMVTETNRYAQKFINEQALKRNSRVHEWKETNPVEMKQFLGTMLLMGVVQKPKIADYWSTNPVIGTPFVNTIMTRNRFQLLLKFWHFSDSDNAPEGDRLYKLQGLCDVLLSRFQDLYIPGKELSIDESMVLWRGRLLFRQYIPGKRHKYGVKLYMLCEPTGYVWNLIVYCGRSDIIAGLGHSQAVVMKLMEKRLDLGHELYIDNFYTGFPLAQQLLNRNTNVCGTLRKNRKHLPKVVVTAKLRKGQVVRQRNNKVVVLKWRDKREVMMLSTFHSGKMIDSGKTNRQGERIRKPDSVLSYNQHMCGVDRTDQLTSYYSPLRKSLRWYRKVVLHFFDLALINSYILYKKTGGRKDQSWFRIHVVQGLIESNDRPATQVTAIPKRLMHHKSADLSRLIGQHYMDIIPATASRKDAMLRCVVCTKRGKRKESRYQCKTCMSRPGLCIVPCFEVYHREQDF